jgi:NSS family neurotransmitter:Na+ symporter
MNNDLFDSDIDQVKSRGWRRGWSFVAAASGAAIGLGNVWKFSYLAGENGGAAFVMAYLICVLLVALPVMIAEVVLGARGRSNPVSAMQVVALEAGASPWWQCIGWMGCVAGMLVLSYYSVVAGWGLAYIGKMYSSQFNAVSVQLAGDGFAQLLSSPIELIQWHSLFLAMVLLVVCLGVRRGLSVAARMLIPLLFIMLIALVLYSSQVGDLEAALTFMFAVDFSRLSIEAWLEALGHAFFTLSIGVGAILTYGGYSPDKRSITGMVAAVVVMDTVVSLLAGLAIFPLVFSFNIAPAMGPGLLFVAMPYSFGNMAYGDFYGALFFVMVSLAALGSGIALLEPATAWLVERFRWWRPAAAGVVATVVWLLGLATIFSFNVWSDVRIANRSVFGLLDFITANILLPLGGLLIALFVGWKMRREVLRDELYVEGEQLFSLWYWLLRYIAAPGVLLVFAAALYQYLM